MKKYLLTSLILMLAMSVSGQQLFSKKQFTRQDTLRGSITKERGWWDLLYYELTVSVNPDEQSINGKNKVRYKVLESSQVLQIDLQSPMVIDKAVQGTTALEVTNEGSAHFIKLVKNQIPGEINEIEIQFSGKPLVAKNAPWDGGFTWSKDSNGKPFIATSCQGIGASLWWPCKDHMYDEPDNGMLIHLNVPSTLIAVANGRLKKEKTEKDKTKTFTWEVINPINNYGVNINVGDYVKFSEKYAGEKDHWIWSIGYCAQTWKRQRSTLPMRPRQ
jgi:aminopeptidase N